jgi:predicted nucleotide-binding protein (sugar kinase/HSP70/actin superfamily)
MVARAGVHALGLDADDIDGVIHLTAFACGPDATVDKLLEIEARKNNAKPFLSLCLDEQTGEAGCLTRLEAFVDMLRRQKDQQAKETAAQPVRQA